MGRYDEFCESVLETDYKAVEASHSGQIIHGKSAYKEADAAKQEAEEQKAAAQSKHDRLEAILARSREMLVGVDCSESFIAADENSDGHCGYDAFAQLLHEMNLGLTDDEVELMMESFYDEGHPDQTRPMSLAVLDEAL